ncbi:hypothetical protein BDV06DRAFT_191108 [Aspergillus oleicola]
MLAGPSITGRIAQQQFAAFARSSRSMSSFRPQISRLQPVRQGGKILGGNLAWRASVPSIAFPSARFNSTSSSSPSEIVREPSAQSTEWDLSNTNINDIPEHIGYLKDLGLDYGWGPSAFMQYMLEHMHMYTGLPWLASLVATGILVRTLMLPLFFKSGDQGARMANSFKATQPVRLRMFAASRDQNRMEIAQCRAELKKINDELGIKQRWIWAPMLVQMPIGFGIFRVVRGMCNLPVPALAHEQFAWITDLTAIDPYFILPIAASVILHLTLRKGGEFGTMNTVSPAARKLMWYGLPAFSFMWFLSLPAALQVYFVTTALFGLGQTYLMGNNSFRKMIGMTPLQRPQPGATVEQSTGRSIRMITEAIEREQAAMRERAAKAAQEAEQQKISVIDRAINSIKETGRAVGKEAQVKMDEIQGKGPKTNADGTPAEPPRLSDKDRRLAADYEKRRKEEEDWKREERNHARRQEFLKEQERQRQQAKSALNKKMKQ